MRLWIAAFLLLLFSCQALPVLAMGKSLLKAQSSLIDADDDAEDGSDVPTDSFKLKKQPSVFEDDFLSYDPVAARFESGVAKQLIFLHQSDHLLISFVGEVLTPPPNC